MTELPRGSMDVNRMKSVKYPFPQCFTSAEQFAIWREEASRTTISITAGYCTDCTPEYQTKMIAQNRCAHTDILFARDEDGFVTGYSREKRKNYTASEIKNVWLTPDKESSVKYVGPASSLFPMKDSFVRVPLPKVKRKGKPNVDTGKKG